MNCGILCGFDSFYRLAFCSSSSFAWRTSLSAFLTLSDLEAVIPILPYKVPRNPTTLLSQRTRPVEQVSDNCTQAYCLYYDRTVSHGCPQGIGPVSIAADSQFLSHWDLPELNLHTLGVCHTCEALAYWITHVPLGQKTTTTDPQELSSNTAV